MAKHFPRTAHDKSIAGWDTVSVKGIELPPSRTLHGHAVTRKIKAICNACNHGWMSQIEAKAKPCLEPMLLGRRAQLNPAAQQAVVEWVVLKMMVWEMDHPPSAVFSREQTLAFGQERKIPANVHLWIGRSADSAARITREFGGVFRNAEDRLATPKLANTQAALFRVGKLVVFFFHSQIPDLQIGRFRQVDMQRLWPLRGIAFSWPPIRMLGWPQMDHMAKTLGRFLGRPSGSPL